MSLFISLIVITKHLSCIRFNLLNTNTRDAYLVIKASGISVIQAGRVILIPI